MMAVILNSLLVTVAVVLGMGCIIAVAVALWIVRDLRNKPEAARAHVVQP